MAKLSNLRSRLTGMQSRLGGGDAPKTEKERAAYRRGNDPSWPLYNNRKWQKVRYQVLVDARFTCAYCKRLETDTSLLVADHVIPHRGDPVKFWAGPFQCLCRSCHSSKKQSEERRNPTPKGTWY